jgi:hypothetical protein
MANRSEKIEIENVHNHDYHPDIKWQFEYFPKINRTVVIISSSFRGIVGKSHSAQRKQSK